MALGGMIFDLDGTLVDSNGVHVRAWQTAFARFDYTVGTDRIAVEIGKGGDTLIPSILGEQLAAKDGEKLGEAESEEFAKLARKNGLRVFPGSRELLADLRRRGIKTALATSSGQKHLKVNAEASGFPAAELVDEVVNADDIQTSKPAPDLVMAAVRKLKMSPAQCAMVGDTPHDAEAAKNAGVVCLGVTCGGRTPAELLRAGARATWRDPADVLAHLDDALTTASPGPAHLTNEMLERLVQESLDAARDGMNHGEVPIGAVIARGDGTIIARGYNELNRTGDKTAHAEMVTFMHARGKVSPEARDLILVSSLEPCVMCLGATMEAAVDTIVYALKAPADSGTRRVTPPESPGTMMPRIVGDILADQSRSLLREWLSKPGNNPEQVKFVNQLLSLVHEGT
jgi:HAD superfamily hydrolase (TIGR01509 family)